ncbi:hypothetical protein ACIO3O_36815 [Streptomyces sp. NPDC087440]|uniref:hypothetical protein n=1 Tax=Streptomyces sp. NPDC087440 TaxID=3365790 RepID=UPI00382A41FB
MSTTATPPTPTGQVLAAFARSGYHLDAEVLDEHLAEIAEKAAGSLVRDQWKPDFPAAAYCDLLTAVAALRDVLGFDPSCTAVELFAKARKQHEAAPTDGTA